MTKYIYEGGILTDQTANGIKSSIQKYPFAMEVSNDIEKDFYIWANRNIESVNAVGEGCMGEPYQKTYTPYGICQKDETSHFIFFLRKFDKNKFICDHDNCIINYEPFKTIIE